MGMIIRPWFLVVLAGFALPGMAAPVEFETQDIAEQAVMIARPGAILGKHFHIKRTPQDKYFLENWIDLARSRPTDAELSKVAALARQKAEAKHARERLAKTDAQMAEVLESLINVLVDKNVIKLTDLSPFAQDLLKERKVLREKAKD